MPTFAMKKNINRYILALNVKLSFHRKFVKALRILEIWGVYDNNNILTSVIAK